MIGNSLNYIEIIERNSSVKNTDTLTKGNHASNEGTVYLFILQGVVIASWASPHFIIG